MAASGKENLCLTPTYSLKQPNTSIQKKCEQVLGYFEFELSTWGGKRPEGLTLLRFPAPPPSDGVCLLAGRWECPWHDCTICSTPASSFCDFCPRSYCRDHEDGALTPSSLEGRLCCSSHNPASPLGSSSSSTQPHCSVSSPVSVKEEPETDTALMVAE